MRRIWTQTLFAGMLVLAAVPVAPANTGGPKSGNSAGPIAETQCSIAASDIMPAIQMALERAGLSRTVKLAPEDLHLALANATCGSKRALHVTRTEFDPEFERIYFVVSQESKTVPFFVFATLSEGVREELRGHVAPSINGPGVTAARFRLPPAPPANVVPIVRPGAKVTLLLNSDGMRMTLLGTEMERGALDQIIRVRVLETGHVIRARVIAADQLEASF